MLTKHMLFVGFSLRDENFHKVANTVNKAIDGYDRDGYTGGSHPNGSGQGGGEGGSGGGGAQGRGGQRAAIGTVITLHYRPFLNDLWPQLALVPMEQEEGRPIGHCSRKLEIFLDRVSLLASTTSRHLLDANFDGTFSPQEHALREELLAFRRRLAEKPEARKASAYRLVRDMLSALGDDERVPEHKQVYADPSEPWREDELVDEALHSGSGAGAAGGLGEDAWDSWQLGHDRAAGSAEL
ncbi:hypothetical protein T492DRAFT_422596 [Pavlovales sp. CCMP2436]|nr:hypothetical protein T492DRAFT_422596 [Pavlovales sp. CCMP2436]